MKMLCKVLGHKYNEYTENREEQENDMIVKSKYKVKKCKRCDIQEESKIKTEVRDKETKIEVERDDDGLDGEIETQKDSNYNSNNRVSQVMKPQEDTGIILQSNAESESHNIDDRNKDNGNKYEINCSNCDHSYVTSNPSRRSGDFCRRCGSTIEVSSIIQE